MITVSIDAAYSNLVKKTYEPSYRAHSNHIKLGSSHWLSCQGGAWHEASVVELGGFMPPSHDCGLEATYAPWPCIVCYL